MSTNSNIEWTEKTWNPLAGCSKISAGCRECYAIKMAWRLAHIEHSKEKYADTVVKTAGGNVNWTGKISIDRKALFEPMHDKKPSMYFVNSMSDLFHEEVPISFIAEVFAVMFHCTHHVFQVLTKRADRMEMILNSEDFKRELVKAVDKIHHIHYDAPEVYSYEDIMHWYPFKNVWLGVSVENQKAADERIPHLVNTPAAIRWLSCEPLLGPLDITNKGLHNAYSTPTAYSEINGKRVGIEWTDPGPIFIGLHWVVVGGESGHDARPMHPDWAITIQKQCLASSVPFFFKQWGAYLPFEDTAQPPFIRACNNNQEFDAHQVNYTDKDGKPGKWCNGQWMDALEAQMYCESTGNRPVMFLKKKKGKKAFAALYGKQYKEYPITRNA